MWSSCLVFLDILLHYLSMDSRKNRGRRKKRQTMLRGNFERRRQCGQFNSNGICSNRSSSMAINFEDIFEVSVLSPESNKDPVSYPDADYYFSCQHVSTKHHHLSFLSVNGNYLHKRKLHPPLSTKNSFTLFLVR